MANKELNFETGLVTYSINNKCEVCFNPTDSGFIQKLYNIFDTLDKKQDAYKKEVEAAGNGAEVFDIAAKRDKEMRDILNGLFDTDICTELFGSTNLYALANGLPLWANFLFAIMDEIDSSYSREEKLSNPRLEKYTAKYKRKRR